MATGNETRKPSNTIDYSNWMSNLPSSLKNRPIHTLSIPGSHDSFTYSISTHNDISPDEPEIQCFSRIPCISSIAKHVIYNWSLTQNKTCTEQLDIGIRYFDLRLAPCPKTNKISLIHGLFGTNVEKILEEIREFLNKHSKEIVLLDFQHFYRLTSDNHKWLIDKIKSIFASILCPKKNLENLTLNQLWENHFQVLVFYRNHACAQEFWSGDVIPNPWPNTDDVRCLCRFLQSNYERGRPENKFYVTQGILTPGKAYVVEHLLFKLENCLCNEANKAVLEWLKDKKAGEQGLNVVICDFVCCGELVKAIIEINFK